MPESTFHVYRVPDTPEHYHPIAADPDRYVELFWLPTVGPTPTWLLRRLDHIAQTERYSWSFDALAAVLGVTPSRLRKACDRLVRFGLLEEPEPGTFGVSRCVPWLTHNQVAGLPPAWQHLHNIHVDQARARVA